MNPSIFLLLLLISTFFSISLSTTTFTFINKCHFTIWPSILSNAGQPPLSSTAFELPTNASRSLQSPPDWSGRLWARTGCVFRSSNNGSCATGETPPSRPTAYSEVFKAACPKSYSYAFDDSTSTFTCADAGEFTVTFCPEGSQSQKSSKDPPISPKVSFTSPTTPGGGLMLENDYWLASLTSGSLTTQKSVVISTLLVFIVLYSTSLIFFIKV